MTDVIKNSRSSLDLFSFIPTESDIFSDDLKLIDGQKPMLFDIAIWK